MKIKSEIITERELMYLRKTKKVLWARRKWWRRTIPDLQTVTRHCGRRGDGRPRLGGGGGGEGGDGGVRGGGLNLLAQQHKDGICGITISLIFLSCSIPSSGLPFCPLFRPVGLGSIRQAELCTEDFTAMNTYLSRPTLTSKRHGYDGIRDRHDNGHGHVSQITWCN